MHTVAVLVFDRIPTFELAVPCEVFGVDRSEMGVPNYRLLLCRAEPGLLRAVAGFTLDVPHDLSALPEADTVIVPAWRDITEMPPDAMLAAVNAAYVRGSRIVALCSGAFVLAAAGLLDGRRATTHWMYAEALASQYPRVQVDAHVLYVDEGQILTSAGTAAGIDLCLHLVRLDYGASVANVFARRMLVSPHRDGGQLQFVPTAVPSAPEDGRLGETMSWALDRLEEPLTVGQLAQHAGLPIRTFARRFLHRAGTSPGRWLLRQRILAAQRALETGSAPVERIAQACGFGSAAALRMHFRREVGLAPTAYRSRFRANGGANGSRAGEALTLRDGNAGSPV